MLSGLSPTERRQIVTGGTAALKAILDKKAGAAKPTAPAAAAPATPAAEINAAPSAEPTAPAVEPMAPAATTPEEEGGEDDAELKRMRVHPRDYQEREVIRLMKDKRDAAGNVLEPGMSLRDAYLKVYGTTTPAANQTTEPAATPPAATADPTLQGYDKQITDLTARLDKLSKDRNQAREDVDNAKADQLSDEIADAKAELKLLSHERNGYLRHKEVSETRSIEQQITSSRDRALATYPDLQAADSMARLALDGYVQSALADPKRAQFFADPTWPEKITAEFAAKHGLKKAGSSAATPPAAPPATPPKAATPTTPAPQLRPKPQQVPGAKLNSGADGGQPSATQGPTVDDLRAALPQMNAAQRRELFRRASAKAGAR